MIGATFTASMARCALLCAALCAPLVARAAVAAADSTNAPAKEDVPPPGTGQPTPTGGPAASSVDLLGAVQGEGGKARQSVGAMRVLCLLFVGVSLWIALNKVAKVTIRGLDFGYSRGIGASVQSCSSTRFEGCRFFDLGDYAVLIENGHDSGLAGCDIWNTGQGGVELHGGDRATLTPARLYVDNCDIHNYQRRSMTYRPGVAIEGVGNRVSHCAIHDAPHSAIIFGGNDHVIEFNEFYRTISRTGDGGVVYTGRNWTARGTQIRSNYFHDNIGLRKWEVAIYFDDLASGLIAKDNLIERCHWAFLIGGGRDNVVTGNRIVDCKVAFHCDARGLGWAANSKSTMMAGLAGVPYQSTLWTSRYPALARLLNAVNPMAPADNVIRGNALVRSGKVKDATEALFGKTALFEKNAEAVGATPASGRRPKWGLLRDAVRRPLPHTGNKAIG